MSKRTVADCVYQCDTKVSIPPEFGFAAELILILRSDSALHPSEQFAVQVVEGF